MITIEITKDCKDGQPLMERKSFINEKEMYEYIMLDMLETYLERAREDLDKNAFTGLCLKICGFMAEYFT